MLSDYAAGALFLVFSLGVAFAGFLRAVLG